MQFFIWFFTYVIIALACVAMWVIAPAMSLIIFLIISVWHFGGDWSDSSTFARLSFGVWVLCLPAAISPNEVMDIFGDLILQSLVADNVVHLIIDVAEVLFLMSSLYLAVNITAHRKAPQFKQRIIDITCLAAGALLLPIMLYFVLYFCALHSPRHLLLSFKTVDSSKSSIIVIVLLTLLTLLLGTAAWSIISDYASLATATLQVIFVGLFALTVPHMFIIHLFETHLTKREFD
ncbi:Brp/Blh family beta-carotene 15,15'-dioxygenase [Veronia nyctiphanis]|uniref:Brp/Blh family beta-carotene 15,15'-dioxygenase n=1 Tax=Veronia nyctiphanis TaxID=1278244 RepID=UPI002E26EE4C